MSLAKPPLQLDLELVRSDTVDQPDGVEADNWNGYLLRDPDGSGRYDRKDLLWSDAIEADILATEERTSVREAVAHLEVHIRTFMESRLWQRIAARIQAARAAGRAVVLNLRSAAGELYALPWQLLDIAGTPLYRTDDCLIRYQKVGLSGARHEAAPLPSRRILAVCAGWVGPDHADAVTRAARAAHVPFDREQDVCWCESLDDLDRALASAPATILHLACHGKRLPDGKAYGLELKSGAPLITPDQVRKLLQQPHARSLRLVVLATCMGANPGSGSNALGSVAQSILEAGVPAAIASHYPLSMEGAVELARILYHEVLSGHGSVEQAFLAARAALRARQRTAGDSGDIDAMAIELHGCDAPAVDFRPWIVRPYRGLDVYDHEDASLFCGREDDRARLLQRMRDALTANAPRFLLVAGASNTGKSSLVRAGLVADLEAGKLGDGQTWKSLFVRPGAGEPLDAIVARHGGRDGDSDQAGARLALVVDPLEDIFTVVAEHDQREAFLRRLWQLARQPDGRVFVIAAMRLEHMARLGSIGLDEAGARFDSELFAAGRYHLLGQLGLKEYERIIREPAATTGIYIEPGLVDRLLDASVAQPGALPLLSFTLDRLWQERCFKSVDIADPASPLQHVPVTGWWLTDAAYNALDGIAGALVRWADELVAGLAGDEENELRRVLIQLVSGNDDATLITRRRRCRDDLRPDDATEPDVARIHDSLIDRLINANLLVTGSAGAQAPVWLELAHDALLHFWPKLRDWYKEARTSLVHVEELCGMASAWQPHALEDDTALARASEEPYLLRGERLVYHVEMWRLHGQLLGARERQRVQAFLDASARAEAERDTVTRDALLVDKAKYLLENKQVAWAACLLGEVERPGEVARWLPLALEALVSLPVLAATLRGHASAVTAVAFSPGDELVLTASIDRTARLFRSDGSGQPAVLAGHEDAILSASFSPDGQLVVTTSKDGTARIWPIEQPDRVTVLRGHDSAIGAAAFSRDSQLLITTSRDGTARIWRISQDGNVSSDGPGPAIILAGHDGAVLSAEIGHDGLVLTAASDGLVRLWRVDVPGARADTLAVLRDPRDTAQRTLQTTFCTARFSGDGRYIVAGLDKTVCLYESGDPSRCTELGAHEGGILSVALHPDGEQVIAVSQDGRATIWYVDGSGPASSFQAPQGWFRSAAFSGDGALALMVSQIASRAGIAAVVRSNGRGQPVALGEAVTAAAFSPDSKRVAIAGRDGIASIWRIASELTVIDDEASFQSASFSPDGTQVLVASAAADFTARLVPVATFDRPIVFRGHRGPVYSAAFSPDGTLIVTASLDQTARIWSAVEPGPGRVLSGHEGVVRTAAFSPDGQLVITASGDCTARVWSVADAGQVSVLGGHDRAVDAAAFSSDGRYIITVSDGDRSIRVWQASDRGLVAVLRTEKEPLGPAAFSPDGRYVVSCHYKTARVWPIEHPDQAILLRGHTGHIYGARFSLDGGLVVTSASDGTARIWPVADPDKVIVLRGHERDEVYSASFSPDSKHVVTTSADRTVRVWQRDLPEAILVLPGDARTMSSACFSPDGKLVLAVTQHQIRLWPVDPALARALLCQVTSDCLPAELRQAYLGESEDEARKKYQACERSHGRSVLDAGPAAPPGS